MLGACHNEGPTRKEIVFRHLNAAGAGLEIGPCHNALAPKREGYNVKILDHLSSDGLRKKYDGHAGVDTTSIEEVDYVWSGQPFADLTDERFDWITASHVIEHTTCLITFINDCASILRPDGILSLVIQISAASTSCARSRAWHALSMR
ncbi:MAG: methyltransferase domain-containing protein [Methyloceanibacter sp.]|jgi:2-polyprenyl-3-methyl-5-hydroxy-6-metoxy-1,4-benzoquinol methylase